MRKIKEILFSQSEHDVILIQPNFLMKILEEKQNKIVREYWKSMKNQEPLGDLPNEVNHGLFSLAASIIKSGYSVDVLDFQAYDMFLRKTENRLITLEDIYNSLKNKKAKIFAISTITVASKNALDIARIIKKINKDSIVAFGGMHPTLFSDEFIKNNEVDLIMLGEGNQTILELLAIYPEYNSFKEVKGIIFKDSNRNIIKTGKKSNYHLNLDELPYPAYDLMCEESLPLVPRFFSNKGCPFSCAFCSCDTFYKKAYDDYKIVFRDPIKVVDEIEYTYNKYKIDFYCFGDLTFMSNKEYGHIICNELIKRKLTHIKWWCQTTVGKLTEEDLKLMKNAGCAQVGLGVENGTQTNLDIMGKPIKFDSTEEQCRLIRKAGIDPITYWIIGLGNETFETANKTIDRICYFIKNNLTEVSHIGVPVPYPGSPIWNNPENYGFVINHTNFSEYWMNSDELGYSIPAISTEHLSEDHIYALWQYALMAAANEYKKRNNKEEEYE
ncbi:radical SAM protein [Fusobacterium sp. SYSU M8D902]|uniref:B12-binding domain-containing radical SAM protein n=1 Tax=Fusobacterium sp. SYSU M8D902 TaxID=3159562 RepID=UPI0032E515B8